MSSQERPATAILKKTRVESVNSFAHLADPEEETVVSQEMYQKLLNLLKAEQEKSAILHANYLNMEKVVISLQERMEYMTQHWGNLTQMVLSVKEDLQLNQKSTLEAVAGTQSLIDNLIAETRSLGKKSGHNGVHQTTATMEGPQAPQVTTMLFSQQTTNRESPTARGRPRVRLAVDTVDAQSDRSTSASVARSATSRSSKMSFKDKLDAAKDDEEMLRKLLFKSKPEVMTEDIWETIIQFPLRTEAVMGGIASSMNSAIRLATGKAPLQIQILSRTRGRVFFDHKLHLKEETEAKLAKAGLQKETVMWSVSDIPVLAAAYLKLGYFRQLRLAILPQGERSLAIQVLEKALELATITEPRAKRRQLVSMVKGDILALSPTGHTPVGHTPPATTRVIREETLMSQSGGMAT